MKSIHILTIFICLLMMSSHQVFASQKADMVVVYKKERSLVLKKNNKEIRRFKIALGGNPIGHKQQEGDQHTPEGQYVLDYKKPDSSYYKAIHISYPNAIDKARAAKKGVSPGGFIMIHGQKNGYGQFGKITQLRDWTEGCIAVTDEDMDLIWAAIDPGTPIEIFP